MKNTNINACTWLSFNARSAALLFSTTKWSAIAKGL